MEESDRRAEPDGHPVTIEFTEDRCGLRVLDQTRLPETEERIELRTLEEIAEAIESLRVRGAPLIGVTAAMGVSALTRHFKKRADEEAARLSAEELGHKVEAWCRRLERTRPTAVNLGWALSRVRAAVAEFPSREQNSADPLAERLHALALDVRDEDRAMCERIGRHALVLLRDGGTAMTHCNAGALATAGIGTALAPVYLAHRQGWKLHVFVDETRPLLQGSRLTAWELSKAGVGITVIADNMAGAAMREHRPDVVLVGADRIAANGDVANKVGTFPLAVLARHHGIPFYVLAPTTTVDLDTPTGADIPIEIRSAEEIRRGFGRLTAPADAPVWSPAFDVTPAELVDGIVTERGITTPPYPDALRRVATASEKERELGAWRCREDGPPGG